MRLKSLELNGFKSFAKKSTLTFDAPITAVVGPNGSGKSNVAESFRFVLGEQSIKNMRGKRGEDLIYNGTTKAGRQNKASAKLTLDNSDKSLNIDFDEVIIERVVHRDGVNDYFINGSAVRLKDVTELLTGANIGSSGHHIISQGEADRILNSSPKDRRAMLEDALGLRTFQYKKIESERKLAKTAENCKDVQLQRKEIAPHLRFLKKQVEKVERANQLKIDLTTLYQDYLAYENRYLTHTKDALNQEKEKLDKQKAELEIKVREEQSKTSEDTLSVELEAIRVKLREEQSKLSALSGEKNSVLREVGSLDGEIRSLERMMEQTTQKVGEAPAMIPREKIQEIHTFILNKNINDVQSLDELKYIFNDFENRIKKLIEVEQIDAPQNNNQQFKEQINEISQKRNELLDSLKTFEEREQNANANIEQIRSEEQQVRSSQMQAERQLFVYQNELKDVERSLATVRSKIEYVKQDKEAFEQELNEGLVLVGREAIHYEASSVDASVVLSESRQKQLERKRTLEKQKIRLEEIGGGTSTEILKEYEEVSERDVFLKTELEDLETAMQGLETLIKELEEEINTRFMKGIDEINQKFKVFFGAMFNGGEAQLIKTVIKKKQSEEDFDEDQVDEIGVDIAVSLPRKKTTGLMMLSGGERALTSIALIFAMSAVNPPPFIILDETDAALDEANSRKYGDMVVNLAEHSQLILITHNRETMSRASTLYGVTMMQGMSELLSIKFEEGVQFAK